MSTATEQKAEPKKADLITAQSDFFSQEDFKQAIARALPKHVTADRMVGVLLSKFRSVENLAKCSRMSIYNCMMKCSQFGLEPDGHLVHLIPYWNNKANCYECQLIIDYKGLVALAYRSGLVSYLHSDVICENDTFSYNMGVIEEARPCLKGERGEMYAAYAICKFTNGSVKAEVMTKDEIEAIRKRSKSGNKGPWVTDYREMCRKTVYRRLSKWIPLSPEHREALYADDDVPPEETIREIPNLSDPPKKCDVSMSEQLLDIMAQQQSGETNVEQEDEGDPNALEGLTDALSEATTTDAINAVELKYAQFCNNRQIAILQEACQIARRKLRNGK